MNLRNLRMRRFFSIAAASILALLAGELLYFHTVLTFPSPEGKAEALVVFNGSAERVKAGHETAVAHQVRYVVFSPASAPTIKAYERRYPGIDSEYILEDKARTTFENAYYSGRIISGHHMESVILLTSVYHMPRSFLLLKLFLLGDGVKLEPLNVNTRGVDWDRWWESSLGRKVVYNEMVKLWGRWRFTGPGGGCRSGTRRPWPSSGRSSRGSFSEFKVQSAKRKEHSVKGLEIIRRLHGFRRVGYQI